MWQFGITYFNLPQDNPFKRVERFAAEKCPRYVPPESDFWAVYEKASDDVDKAFLLTLLHTGARVGEIYRLTWEDLDFQAKRIRLGTKKTHDGSMEWAWLPMTEQLYEMLKIVQRHSTSRLVFPSKTTGKMYSQRQHMMERLCEAAGVKRFGFHAIRHLTATILAYSGLDLPTVQGMLRHHSPNTTARYIQSLGIMPNKIEDAFSNPQKKRAKATNLYPLKNIA